MTLPLSLLLVSIFGCYEKFSFAFWVLVLSSSSPLVFVVGHAGCLVLNDAHGDTCVGFLRGTNVSHHQTLSWTLVSVVPEVRIPANRKRT